MINMFRNIFQAITNITMIVVNITGVLLNFKWDSFVKGTKKIMKELD